MTNIIKILIVEDSKTQLVHLQNLLENQHFNVETATNGRIALAKLQNFTPDIILSDIIMPEMNGYEFCKEVKSDSRWMDIPVILLTALTDPQDVIRGLNVGADNFIPKPFSSEFLISRIQHLLVNKELRVDPNSTSGIEIFFAGNKHLITSNRMQIIDLLLSTYENAVNKNNELIKANQELIKLKETLEVKNVQLQHSNEEKNRFIGIAAHDIRNPLGAIYSFAEILRDQMAGQITDSQEEIIKYIKVSADTLLRLVNDLLDVSKIEAGKLEINHKTENIVDFIRQTISKNKPLSEKKRIKIIEEFESDVVILPFDSARIEQVLNNLISNGIKYSKEDTSIIIKLKTETDRIRLTVIDHGVGIPQEEMSKLFKPFSKTSAATTAGESSTGLGLFTCMKIVEAHKGEIGAISEVGSGSEFFFTLPLFSHSQQKGDHLTKSIDEIGKILSGKKILVVDDNKITYSYYKSVFINYGVEMDWACTGYDGLDYIRSNNYDLILLDIQLPDINGLDVAREIRKFDSDIIIICNSAYFIEGIAQRSIEAGCNAYVSMPVKPKEIIKHVIDNFNKKIAE
jgi:signal transduction histidine kinase